MRHLWAEPADSRRALGDAALARLQAQVHASESQHRGEIRLCIEAGLPLAALWQGASPRQRAQALFAELGVWNTEANSGVLVYLLLADRAIEVVADRGLNAHVSAAQWQAIVDQLQVDLQAGRFEAGLSAALAAVDALLRTHFPPRPGDADRNELPDTPVLR
ncbi:MAG: TPM domain-containing protein [Leptothrix sp. (in: b-proteobacteria)]